jgi:hypothetical protein
MDLPVSSTIRIAPEEIKTTRECEARIGSRKRCIR